MSSSQSASFFEVADDSDEDAARFEQDFNLLSSPLVSQAFTPHSAESPFVVRYASADSSIHG
jgi:hypothetical protein